MCASPYPALTIFPPKTPKRQFADYEIGQVQIGKYHRLQHKLVATPTTMSPSRAIPIIVGVGDIRNKSNKPEDAVEPSKMMIGAIQNAVRDTGLDASAQRQLLGDADSLRIIPTWTWAYNDLLATVADGLRIKPTTTEMPTHGGNQPALQCDEAARAISNGQSKVAILTGGEAMASRMQLVTHDLTKTNNIFSRGLPKSRPNATPWLGRA